MTAISPIRGPLAGGTPVTITGTNFTAPATVSIGGVAATSIAVVNATTITAVTGAHVAGIVDVVVTTPGGTGTGTGLFTYLPPPTVTAISPSSGTTAGGTTVTITGTAFIGATAVTIGGVPATITAVTGPSITAITGPRAAGVVDVVVTAPGGTGTGTGLYTYVAPPGAPTVTAISPTSGTTAGGTAVTITGTNFTGATAVSIGGVAATGVVVNSATTITATTGAHAAGVVDVAVTTAGGTGTGVGLYTYVAPLVLTSTPSALTQVGQPYSQSNVASGGTPPFTYAVSAGSLPGGVTLNASTGLVSGTPTVAGPFSYTITATDSGAPQQAASQTVAGTIAPAGTPAPTVTAINPTSGTTAGGTAVTIIGTSFTGATAVTIGGVAATPFTVVNATTITATTGARAAGVVDVAVTTPGGTGTGVGLFTYVAPAPTVTAINPTSGTTAGGTAVTITGTNFTSPATVSIGGVAATGVVVNSATSITATTGARAAGVVDVAVTTAGGTGTGIGLYTYVAPPGAPTVTAINPASGTTAGGTPVTITGTGFTGATAVIIGGLAATPFTVVNATTITATTGARAPGVVGVAVTTPGGTGVGVGLFTYVAPVLVLTSTPSAATQLGQPYAQTNVASGGTPAFTFAVSAGSLPGGLTLNTATGLVSGTPTTPGPFSYTIQVTDSGSPTQTASQVLSGTIGPAGGPTTTSIASSQNPSAMGQAVTFTARIAPSPAPGSVTFRDGATTLCSAVPLVNGVATCSFSFPAAGAHPITAAYSGAGLFAPSTSPVLTQLIEDQRARTAETIGKFLGRRNDLIASNQPDENRQIDRLLEAGGGPVAGSPGVGFAGTGAGAPSSMSSRLWAGPDAGDLSRMRFGLGLRDRQSSSPNDDLFPAPGGRGGRFDDTAAGGGTALAGPMRLQGNTDDAMRFGFATSLRDMSRYSAEAEARKAAEAGLGLGLSADPGRAVAGRSNPFDIWIEGKYASFNDSRASNDLDGHFGLVSIGADYVLNPTLLVGTVVQIDSMSLRSSSQASDVRGHGWMAGPYATLRLTDNLFWQARAAWGQSSNEVSPFLTYTDRFDTERWLVSSTFRGRWTYGAWVLRPSATLTYMEDVAKSYTDTFGVVIPDVKSRLGQAKAGPEISYRYQLDRNVVIEPHAGLQVIWNFAKDTTAAGFGQISGEDTGPIGVRAQVELGLRATTSGGLGLDLSSSYDGIGSGRYNAVTGKAAVRIPLN